MLYALIHKPAIDTSKIDAFRQKYDPHHNLVGPHITLVFPVRDADVEKDDLVKHIESILRRWKPFRVHIKGLDKSWDQWLNLNLQEGNNEVIALHDELYTGVLEPYLRKDLGYTPHIGLGLFVPKDSGYKVTNPELQPLDEPEYEKALTEAESLNLDYWAILDNAELITLDDEVSKVIESRVFRLS